jgi:5,5'-dehydrodivanillate O-demethylase
MLTEQENERLTRVGRGTPGGELLRRYWHPIVPIDRMRGKWTQRVRLLGEDLVLYRDRSGKLGLIGEQCPHRRASLAYGIPTENGIRCPYHGWQFDGTGTCLEQPNEPEGSTFKEKVDLPGYPVQEFAGLIWAYLGPLPAPLIPRLDGLVAPHAIRTVGITHVNCNWLQIMENSVDPVHTEWLHGKLFEFVYESEGRKTALARHHAKIAFDEFEYGIIKRRLMEDQDEDCADWRVGHPIVFPTTLAVSSSEPNWTYYQFQFRTPVDDTHTEHFWYAAFEFPEGTAIPEHLREAVPAFDAPQRDESGEYMLKSIHAQDVMAWETQGPLALRQLESLGTTDRGVIMLRKMVEREMEKVRNGRDPMGVVRDPAQNVYIELPKERGKDMNDDGFETMVRRSMVSFSPACEEIIAAWHRGRGQGQRELAKV